MDDGSRSREEDRLVRLEQHPPLYGEWSPEQVKQFVEAVQEEQRKAQTLAEREREKAAAALRDQLTQQINQGDESLADHIKQQYEQLRIMLEALRREGDIRADASQAAITKAENATEKRFESVNEFRAQLATQSSEFIPREVADKVFDELRQQIVSATRRVERAEGIAAGENSSGDQQRASTGLVVSLVVGAATVISLVVVLANTLAGA